MDVCSGIEARGKVKGRRLCQHAIFFFLFFFHFLHPSVSETKWNSESRATTSVSGVPRLFFLHAWSPVSSNMTGQELNWAEKSGADHQRVKVGFFIIIVASSVFG